MATPIQTEELPEELFFYTKAKTSIISLMSTWSMAFTEVEMRRKERYVEVDIEALRQQGAISKDQTLIPDRVIDGNIRRELADIMAFLNAGYRLGIFECKSQPNIDTRQLEDEVTKGLTYNGWYTEFEKTADGTGLHGFDYLEVVFDTSKPLHVGFEHVGTDCLYFNRKVEDIQDSEWLIRKYEIPVFRLEQDFVTKFGFNAEQVAMITESFKETRRNDVVTINKGYFKYQDITYVCWFGDATGKTTDWLKAPEKLRLGIWEDSQNIDPMTGKPVRVESDIHFFPILRNLYRNDEQKPLVAHKGRGFLDAPQQEANTAIISGFVNMTTRSQSIYASPDLDDGESAEIKVLDVELEPDGIYNRKMNFWNTPAPDVMLLQALGILDNRNSLQSGQVSFAAANRKDSRKTAKELNLAEDQQSKITSIGLAGFSEFLRGVLEIAWRIIQSQAIDNKIKLLLIEQQTVKLGIPQSEFVNNIEVISQEFDIRPAGDTDVIEAQAEQQKMQQDWPVVQTVPGLKQVFLEDYLKLRYPKHSDQYVQAMKAGDPGKALVKSLGAALVGMTEHPDEIASMGPENKQQLQQLEQNAQQYLAMP